MSDRTETALWEARGGRDAEWSTRSVTEPMLRERLWKNPCWLSFRLNYLSLGFNNPVYAHLQDRFGLLRPDMVVLWTLHLHGESAFSEVVRSVGFPKNTLSRAARKLEGLGLISRTSDAEDLRRVTLNLTPAGQTVVDEAGAVMLAHEAQMLNSLTTAERLALSELLTKLVLDAGNFPQRIPIAAGTAEPAEAQSGA